MGKIRLMPDALASQVAAGEVVERPASVVKELVENSIDAGARNVEIRVERGGLALIRVVDDGEGMGRDDALMSLERHATSKIREAADLGGIATLGFRGEALPSIASVSRFRLATRLRDAMTGTEIVVTGGRLGSVKDSGEAPGTQVEVRSLFFNLPARRKFLRTENTEYGHLEQQVRIQAIAHPEVGFSLIRNDRPQWQLPSESGLLERIRGLAGGELASRLLEVETMEHAGVQVSGYIGGFGMGRSSRSLQLTFLNGRPVEASMLNYALREGFHSALMKGQHPVVFLFLEMSPLAVDVNVHPAKKEVRFRDGNGVRDAVIEAVRRTLTRAQATVPGQRVRPLGALGGGGPMVPGGRRASLGGGGALASVERQGLLLPEREQVALRNDWSEMGPRTEGVSQGRDGAGEVSEEGNGTSGGELEPPDSRAWEDRGSENGGWEAGVEPRGDALREVRVETEGEPGGQPNEAGGERVRGDGEREAREADSTTVGPEDFRIIGVLGKLYVLMESAEGMVLMDQHAAHERVLFEAMRERMAQEGVPSQKLLMPVTVELPPREFDLVRQNLDALQRLGIGAEPFGANTLKIDSLPQFFRTDDPLHYMSEVIEELKKVSRRMSSMRLGEEMVATTVCRHAVKANDVLRPPELQRLLEDLLRCEMPYCCPHGRPTLIQLSFGELEKRFGRQVG